MALKDLDFSKLQDELLRRLYNLTDLTDFLIVPNLSFNKEDWGIYYYTNKTIVLFLLGEQGNRIDDESIMRIAIHELTHHIQHYYIQDYKMDYSHDVVFKRTFAKLLDKYYNGAVPLTTVEVIKGEGLNYEPKSQTKRKLRRVIKSTTGNNVAGSKSTV